jgi:hypothetical protein
MTGLAYVKQSALKKSGFLTDFFYFFYKFFEKSQVFPTFFKNVGVKRKKFDKLKKKSGQIIQSFINHHISSPYSFMFYHINML